MADGSKFRGLIPLALSAVLELLGIAAIVAGFALISPIAGLFAGGVGLIILGLIVDPPKRPQKPRKTEDE